MPIELQKEKEKLRDQLLSSVSHDLKTPLSAIIGALSVYRSMHNRLSEDQKVDLIDTALTEAHRLDSFISNILDLAKIESGALSAKIEWHSAYDLISQARKRIRHVLKDRLLQIHYNIHDAQVAMDLTLSLQALVNVLDNALKFSSPALPIEVDIRKENNGFAICVRDYGPGIPEDKQESIFNKHTRLANQDRHTAGPGLGLAIARAAMALQNGTISVKNHSQGGAVFTLWWPHLQFTKNSSEIISKS